MPLAKGFQQSIFQECRLLGTLLLCESKCHPIFYEHSFGSHNGMTCDLQKCFFGFMSLDNWCLKRLSELIQDGTNWKISSETVSE